MKNRVLVIIVTYNGMKWIDRCFRSIKESAEPLDVFVVDNGSTDGSVARIREISKEWFQDTSSEGAGWWIVDIVESQENLGFGRANNLGMEYAIKNGYDYIYLLNQDAWVFPDTMTTLINAFEKNPEYGVLSPVQITAKGDKLDPRFEAKCSKYLPDLRTRFPNMAELYKVPFVMAAHWMIRRECLTKIGGFSPAFQHYGEDDNFLDRCKYHKFAVGVDINTKAVHDREMREMPKSKKMRLKYVASIVKVSNPNNLLVWRLIRQPLELLGISVIYQSGSVFAGIFRLIGSYPSLIRYRKASKTEECPFLDTNDSNS